MTRLKATLGQTVRDLLIGDSAVAAIVVARVFPNTLPQNSVLPAIVYQGVSDVPENSLNGTVSTTVKSARVQFDCYARTYAEAKALEVAVESALGDVTDSDLSISLEVSRDLYDDVTQYHRVSMDFIIWR